MKITNKHGLPAAVHVAAQAQVRPPNPELWSITELLSPPFQRRLQRAHWDELEVDVTEQMWALLGSGVHALVEHYATPNARVKILKAVKAHIQPLIDDLRLEDFRRAMQVVHEIAEECGGPMEWPEEWRRAHLETDRSQWIVEGHMTHPTLPIHGTLDFFDGHTLWDLKTTTSYKLLGDEPPKDWVAQLNGYAWLMEKALLEKPKRLAILAVLRDWSKLKAWQDPKYPQSQSVVVEIPLWDPVETEKFYVDLLASHQTHQEEVCTPEERWSKPTTWAVMKSGRKSALRVLESAEAARAWVQNTQPKGGVSIVERPGEDTRCLHYCNVAHLCPLGQSLGVTKNTEEA